MRVLLIEDNPADAQLVQEMLKEATGDFTIDVADRLRLGLKFLAAQDVDVVLLDLGLPDSRGLETLAKLQTQFSHQPVVIMTGSHDEALGVQAVQQGAQDYLVKGQVDSGLLRRSLAYAIERKKTDEALREREQFLARLAELNPAVITVTDLTNNQEIYSSKSGLTLLGYRPEEIKDIASFSASVMYPGDLDRMVAAIAELKKANDDRIRSIEVRAKAGDGRWHWFQILYVIFKRDRNGLPLQAMSVSRDITERREAEEALKRRTYELEAVNKELEAFSYSVSHDLKAPLRHMDGFSQAVLDEYADKLGVQGKDYLQRIRAASQLMGRLMDDLLSLARVTSAEMDLGNTSLDDLAEEVAVELRNSQPGRRVQFVIEKGLGVYGERNLLKLTLQNSMGNAFKFTSKCPEAKIEVGVTDRDGERAYFVRDNGVGFDMRYANKLFQPFQRLHSNKEFPGTGIGLAIVQRIVNRHRGRVWAEGKPGKGATFCFTLGMER